MTTKVEVAEAIPAGHVKVRVRLKGADKIATGERIGNKDIKHKAGDTLIVRKDVADRLIYDALVDEA